jgi:TIR domain
MAPHPRPARTLKLFYSYAHKDERWRKRIETHLSMLQRQGFITGWHDRNINAGATWAGEIDEHLADADIILLLISPDFLSSDYCYSVEMMKAMERHSAGEARVVPVILRPTDVKGTPFEHLQFLPKNSQPVSRWRDRDEALLNLVTEIRKMVDELNTPASDAQPPFDSRPVVAKIEPLALWGIPFHRNPFFTGREDILTHLHSAFTANKAVIFVQAISGLGGIGKTQVAIEYAYRHREEYSAVLWAKADSREILVSGLLAIALSKRSNYGCKATQIGCSFLMTLRTLLW